MHKTPTSHELSHVATLVRTAQTIANCTYVLAHPDAIAGMMEDQATASYYANAHDHLIKSSEARAIQYERGLLTQCEYLQDEVLALAARLARKALDL